MAILCWLQRRSNNMASLLGRPCRVLFDDGHSILMRISRFVACLRGTRIARETGVSVMKILSILPKLSWQRKRPHIVFFV